MKPGSKPNASGGGRNNPRPVRSSAASRRDKPHGIKRDKPHEAAARAKRDKPHITWRDKPHEASLSSINKKTPVHAPGFFRIIQRSKKRALFLLRAFATCFFSFLYCACNAFSGGC